MIIQSVTIPLELESHRQCITKSCFCHSIAPLMVVLYIRKFPKVKRFHRVKFSHYRPFPQKINTWRKRGAGAGGQGVWKRLVYSWLPHLSWNLGGSYWSSYTIMAANFGPNSQTILPVWPMFPTRCGTDGFSICCSICLGWYWGRQRTPWIRKTVTVFCWKHFVCVIFAVTENREYFLTAKISRYTCMVHCIPVLT